MKKTLLLSAMCGLSCIANAEIISFSGLEIGDVITEQYASMGVHISTTSSDGPSNRAFVMNTAGVDHDSDDLFEVGNIPLNTQLGNALLFQHDEFDSRSEGEDSHDDNDNESAQQLVFDFDNQVQSFGFVIMGFNDNLGEHDSIDFYQSGSLVSSIDFDEFAAGGLYDMGANFDGRSLNQIDDIFVEGGFDRVVLNIGDSIGLDNISFRTVPAPGSILVLGLGVGIGLGRRR